MAHPVIDAGENGKCSAVLLHPPFDVRRWDGNADAGDAGELEVRREGSADFPHAGIPDVDRAAADRRGYVTVPAACRFREFGTKRVPEEFPEAEARGEDESEFGSRAD